MSNDIDNDNDIPWGCQGCKTYGDLRDLFVRARNRVQKNMGERYVRDILELLPLVLNDEFVFDMAKKYNFEMQWLDKKKANKRKSADPQILPGQSLD